MQAWELERELGRAQDKLEAIKNLVKEYKETPSAYNQLRRSKIDHIWKILEDRSSGESPT